MQLYDKQGLLTEVPYDASKFPITVDGVVIYNPLRTPDDSAFCTPERYGFTVWQTGGGCLGWGLELEDESYILITDHEGSALPEEGDDDSPFMGLYDPEGEVIASVEDFAELPKNGSAQHGA